MSDSTVKNIGNGIWLFECPFRLFGAEFGNRMSVIRLGSGDLLLHSPIAFDQTVKQQIAALGRVAYLITPNAFHGLFMDEWLTAFPEALHLSAKENRSSAAALSGSAALAGLSPEIEIAGVNGIPKANEFAFFHKPSRTLLLTDLAFNITGDVPLWTRLFFSLNDAYGKFGPSRLMRSMIEDRNAFRESLLNILEWDFEQIVVSHGHVVEGHGKEVMRNAFQHYLTITPELRKSTSLRTPIRCG